MSRKELWESVYGSKSDAELSWTQPDPSLSLSLIRGVCAEGRVIDVGGGNSLLAERLLDRGYSVTVLDISEVATRHARERLAARANQVDWIVADVTAGPELDTVDVWHDRAVFHFLTDPADRSAYVALLALTIPVGRHAVMATFAPDGPEKCSGLEVRRYSGPALNAELGASFELLKTVPEIHVTPRGMPQSFQYSVFKRV
jgi:SAM-dependent methyltransferase